MVAMFKFLITIFFAVLGLFFFSQNAEAAIINKAPTTAIGLVGYWTFDGKNMSGNSAFDLSGNGNTGTLTSGPVRAIGKLGQALSFDGSDDYVALPDLSQSEDGIYSYIAWINTTQTGIDKWIVSEGNTGANDPIAGIINNNGVARAYWRNDGTSATNSLGTTKINDGIWHFIAVTADGVSQRLYVDGKQEDSDALVGGVQTVNVAAIGRLSRSTPCCNVNGLMF